ncbi:tRNA 2'-phosphotransferase 1 [Galendromus occidentalis]|uniref:2'-phosphotransferase n=1 Tax=Galendromus occidentalis TaxID=34638 RepID=A0AAJ7L5M4_9ACAR|nr:tRNA 2'-phosphotransferase 1 [Galendromus occidentalis]
MCASFVNNYSSDFNGHKIAQHQLAANTSKPRGFSNDERFSKALSYLLRHGAPRARIEVEPGGFVDASEVLRYFNHQCTEEDIERVVFQDKKQRYAIRKDPATGRMKIRANQGHTFPVVEDGTLLEIVVPEAGLSEVTHGTTASAWLTIREEGLSRMKRNHIHFIQGRATASDCTVPGFRKAASVLIVVNLRRAILDGIRFYRSQNNVILSPGNEKGLIPPEYFQHVVNIRTNETLWPLGGDTSALRLVSPESPNRILLTGVTMTEWKRVKKAGLVRKKGDFIRFKAAGLSGDHGFTGFAVGISIDVREAMAKGIEFFYLNATNDVIVSKGDERGIIPSKFFARAVDLRTGALLWPAPR